MIVEGKDVQFVKDFFKKLNDNDIKYCVLRNTREILNGDVHDIDMTFDFRQKDYVMDLLLLMAKNQGWKIHLKAKKDNGNLYTIHLFLITEEEPIIVHFDFFKAFGWNGYSLINYIDLMDERRVVDGLWEASDAVQAVTMLFSRFLYQGYIKEKYKDKIFHYFRENEEKVKELMSGFLTSNSVIRIYDNVVACKWDIIEKMQSEIHKEIIQVFKSKYVLPKVKNKAFALKRLLKHTGLVVQVPNQKIDETITICEKALSRTFSTEEILNKANVPQGIKEYFLTDIELSKGRLIITNHSYHINRKDLVVVDEKNISEGKLPVIVLNKMSERYKI